MNNVVNQPRTSTTNSSILLRSQRSHSPSPVQQLNQHHHHHHHQPSSSSSSTPSTTSSSFDSSHHLPFEPISHPNLPHPTTTTISTTTPLEHELLPIRAFHHTFRRSLSQEINRIFNNPHHPSSDPTSLPRRVPSHPHPHPSIPSPPPPLPIPGSDHQPPQPSFSPPSPPTAHPPPALQNRTREFIHHSSRIRLNRRHRLSPLPTPSSSDQHILDSLESFRRSGERRKRSQCSPDTLKSSDHPSHQSSEPTTAELAEAAARASNEHNALPAFYSPDQSLVVTKVVIPVDTNPMERRKIIFEASKDGSIRWNDAYQKAVYERSRDGLVGEEIGEIEFSYISLPQPKSIVPVDKKPLIDGLNSSTLSPILPPPPTSSFLDRPTHDDGSLSSDTERAIREALERMNRARNPDHHHHYHHPPPPPHPSAPPLQSRPSAHRDHQAYHSNRYQIYQNPRYRLLASSRRNLPASSRDPIDSTHHHHHHQSPRNLNLSRSVPIGGGREPGSMMISSEPREEPSERVFGESNRRSSSMNRLSRRPLVFLERPSLSSSLNRVQSSSFSAGHDPFFFGGGSGGHPHPLEIMGGNDLRPIFNGSSSNDLHPLISRSSAATTDRFEDPRTEDSLYNQFYNPQHHHQYSSLDHLVLHDY